MNRNTTTHRELLQGEYRRNGVLELSFLRKNPYNVTSLINYISLYTYSKSQILAIFGRCFFKVSYGVIKGIGRVLQKAERWCTLEAFPTYITCHSYNQLLFYL